MDKLKFVFLLLVLFSSPILAQEAATLEEYQSIFQWIPELKSQEDIALWYMTTFSVRFSGGSFHEISIEDVRGYVKKIPAALKSTDHLGFHDVFGIRPFQFTTSKSSIEIPEENKPFIKDMTLSLKTWLHMYETEGLGNLILSLSELPTWMQGIQECRGKVSQEELKALKSILGEELWSGQSFSSQDLERTIQNIASVSDHMEKNDERRPLLRRVLFPLYFLKGLSNIQGGDEILRSSSALNDRLSILEKVFDFLINHDLLSPKGASQIFISSKIKESQKILSQKLNLKEGDQQNMMFLVGNGLSGILRGNFCEQPTCATGRNGEHHQHRNSTLMQEDLLLIPVMDGEMHGYIELMKENVEGTNDSVLVLKTIQFDELTPNGALILFSHLYHSAKKSGAIGLALPKNLIGKSNIERNKTIIADMVAYQEGTPLTVTPLNQKEWVAAQKSFGKDGAQYYEEESKDAYVLLNPTDLVSQDRLSLTSSSTAPQIDPEANQREKEYFRTAKAEVLLATGLGLSDQKVLKFYLKLLHFYGHTEVEELLSHREEEDFFDQLVTFFEDKIDSHVPAEQKERKIKDTIQYVFKSIRWHHVFEEDEYYAVDFFHYFIQCLGEDRFLRAYKDSIHLRTLGVLAHIEPEWLVELIEYVSGNQAPVVLQEVLKRVQNSLSDWRHPQLLISNIFFDRIKKRAPIFLQDEERPNVQILALDIIRSLKFISDPSIQELCIKVAKESKNAAVQEKAIGALGAISNQPEVQAFFLEYLLKPNDSALCEMFVLKALSDMPEGTVLMPPLRDVIEAYLYCDGLCEAAKNVLKKAIRFDPSLERRLLKELRGIYKKYYSKKKQDEFFLSVEEMDARRIYRDALLVILGEISDHLKIKSFLMDRLMDPVPDDNENSDNVLSGKAFMIEALRKVSQEEEVRGTIIKQLDFWEYTCGATAVDVLAPYASDEKVKKAFLKILKKHEHESEIVQALKMEVSDPRVKEVFIKMITDDSTIGDVREEVVDILDHSPPTEKSKRRRNSGLILNPAAEILDQLQAMLTGIDELTQEKREEVLIRSADLFNSKVGQMAFQSGLSMGHFGVALFVKHFLESAFTLDGRPVKRLIAHFPKEMISIMIFMGGSGVGSVAYDVSKVGFFKIYSSFYKLIYRNIVQTIVQNPESLTSEVFLNRFFSAQALDLFLRHQACFAAGLAMSQYILEGEVNWKNVAKELVSFSLLHGAIVLGTTPVLVQAGEMLFKAKTLTGTWGWVVTAIQLGLTMTVKPSFDRALTQIDVNQKKKEMLISLQQKSHELWNVASDKTHPVDSLSQKYIEFKSQTETYRSLDLWEMMQVQAQYQKALSNHYENDNGIRKLEKKIKENKSILNAGEEPQVVGEESWGPYIEREQFGAYQTANIALNGDKTFGIKGLYETLEGEKKNPGVWVNEYETKTQKIEADFELSFFEIIDHTRAQIKSQSLTSAYLTTKGHPTLENINSFNNMLRDYKYGIAPQYYGGFNAPSLLMQDVLNQDNLGAPYDINFDPNPEINIVELLLRQGAYLSWLSTQTQDPEKQSFLNLKSIETQFEVEGLLQFLSQPFIIEEDPETQALLAQAFSSKPH